MVEILFHILAIVATCIVVGHAGGAMAAADPPNAETQCDEIAALRLPHTSIAAVHETKEADWPAGVTACEAAVRAHPEEPRFMYKLGRAQDHAGNYIEALRAYKAVIALNQAEALVDLGTMYYLGHGVVQNYHTTFDYFAKAEEAGSVRGLANTASM